VRQAGPHRGTNAKCVSIAPQVLNKKVLSQDDFSESQEAAPLSLLPQQRSCGKNLKIYRKQRTKSEGQNFVSQKCAVFILSHYAVLGMIRCRSAPPGCCGHSAGSLRTDPPVADPSRCHTRPWGLIDGAGEAVAPSACAVNDSDLPQTVLCVKIPWQ
jgi:hypothetical protein